MTLEELQGLSTAEAIDKAAAYAGVRPEVLDNLWATESARGTHPTMVGPDTKWGKAKGHFQQLDNIHATWEQRTGKKLDRMRFEDGLFMAALQLRENMDSTKSEADAVAMYHGGTNRKNWGEKTQAYVAAITGGPISQQAVAERPRAKKVSAKAMRAPSYADVYDVRGADITAMYAEAEPPAPLVTPVLTPREEDVNTAALGAVRAGEAAAVATQKEIDAQPFLGYYDRNTTLGATISRTMEGTFNLARRMTGDLDRPVDPEWGRTMSGDWDKYLGGLNADEQDDVMKATSKQDYEDRIFRIQTRREDEVVMGRAGTGGQLAAGVLAGALDPTSWLIGGGVAGALGKAGLGSAALVAQGRAGAAAASVIGENVAGNVAYEAVQAAMGDHRGLADYGMAAVGGLIPGAVFGGLSYRKAVNDFRLGKQQEVIAERFDMAVQAIKNVGEDAPPATIKAEMTRLENQHYEQTVASRGAGPSAGDKIESPNLDEVKLDEPEAGASNVAAPERADVSADTTPLDSVDAVREAYGPNVAPKFEDPAFQQKRVDALTHNPQWAAAIKDMSDVDFATARTLPAGVHVAADAANNITMNPAIAAVKALAKEYLPEGKIMFGSKLESSATAAGADGLIISADKVHYIGVLPTSPSQALNSSLHELGHAIVHQAAPNVPASVWAAVDRDWLMFVNKARSGMAPDDVVQQRFAPTSAGNREAPNIPGTAYALSRDEYLAEQFIKHIQTRAMAGELGSLPVRVIKSIVSAIKDALAYVLGARRKGYLQADEGAEQLFREILANAGKQVSETNAFLAPDLQIPELASFNAPTQAPRPGKLTAADAALSTKHGLDLMPRATPRERAEFKAVLDLYRKADEWAVNNPRDDAKVKVLGNNSLVNVALPATLLATSDNSLSRMVAGTLLEQSTGALGRRNTAAILKYSLEQGYIGNALLDYDQAYTGWRNANGGGWIEDTFKGDRRNAFNRLVATEVEQRRAGVTTQADALVKRAADTLEQGYERMRLSQVDTKTVGWARLPDTSVGYMPHRIAANRLRDASDAELRVFVDTLTEQFVGLNDWDLPFAQEMARKYLDHARVRSLGGHDIPANIHDPAAAEMVRGALTAMGMTQDEVLAQMGRFGAGGPSHTKKRAVLNLTTEYPDGKGGVFRLMDMFDTDHVSLLRNQARRVSGEVALAQHGIMGSQGLKLLRRGLEFGNNKLGPKELEAFDQVAAEMLGNPFGTATGKWMERTMTANTLARLGGMGWTQLGESLNGIWAVGAEATMHSVTSMPRLRGEVAALARGETVKNGILHSMEQPGGGGEFGLDGYKMVTAFDSPEHAYASYGHDSATWVDRAMRRGAHALGTLSMHRMIHAVQRRGMAEQITLKAIRFIRDGGESKALADMGFTPDVVARLKADLPNMVQYDASGRVREFDITKAKDLQAARAFSQSVHRGAAQIIQGSFIGEQGKWAHNGFLKVLTQFRSFPLVAMEKQWARQRGMHGVAGALGILTGSMAMVAPIYMARVAFSAIGRPDREEYLEQRLSPQAIARATLNYVGVAGLSGDLLDLLSTATGIGQTSGGRTGTGNKSFVSTTIPGVGYVDDVYRAATNPSDPAKWARILPFNNVPLMVPAINALRPD